MRLFDLKMVLAICEEGSFTNAAKRMYISQPAISQNVLRLEKELNLSLFVRMRGKVSPTKPCQKIAEYASKIVDLWQQMEDEMKSYSSGNVVQIGTTSFFFQFLSDELRAAFQRGQSSFRYNIIEDTASNIERMTCEGKLDFCFTRYPLQQTALKYESLFTEEILFAMPSDHPLRDKYLSTEGDDLPVINLAEFSTCSFVMVNNARIAPLCFQMCGQSGFTPQIVMQPSTWEHVITVIKDTGCVGFVSNFHRKKGIETGLSFFRIDSDLAELKHIVAYRFPLNITGHSREFIDAIKNYVRANL